MSVLKKTRGAASEEEVAEAREALPTVDGVVPDEDTGDAPFIANLAKSAGGARLVARGRFRSLRGCRSHPCRTT